MTRTQPIRAASTGFVVVCLAILAMALAACGGAPTAASPAPTAAPTAPSTPASIAGPAATPVPPAAATEPQTIHLIERPTNVSEVRVGSFTGCTNTTSCQGDYIVGNDPMVEVATGEKVGSLAFECFIVDTGDTLYHCPGITLTLTGRGQIVFTEFFWAGVTRPETSPITGGTGEFLGVTGTVTSERGGDFVITISK